MSKYLCTKQATTLDSASRDVRTGMSYTAEMEAPTPQRAAELAASRFSMPGVWQVIELDRARSLSVSVVSQTEWHAVAELEGDQ